MSLNEREILLQHDVHEFMSLSTQEDFSSGEDVKRQEERRTPTGALEPALKASLCIVTVQRFPGFMHAVTGFDADSRQGKTLFMLPPDVTRRLGVTDWDLVMSDGLSK